MCENCNCKTIETDCQSEEKLCAVSQSNKKDVIEHSLNCLLNSLDRLEALDERISNIQIEESGINKSKIVFESLEVLLNDLPDQIYKASYRIDKLVENIDAKLF